MTARSQVRRPNRYATESPYYYYYYYYSSTMLISIRNIFLQSFEAAGKVTEGHPVAATPKVVPWGPRPS